GANCVETRWTVARRDRRRDERHFRKYRFDQLQRKRRRGERNALRQAEWLSAGVIRNARERWRDRENVRTASRGRRLQSRHQPSLLRLRNARFRAQWVDRSRSP